MPVNTPALGPGGGPNAPFGLGGTAAPGDVTTVGSLAFGSGFGQSLDTTSSDSAVAQCSTISFTGRNYAVPASDSITSTLVWTQARPNAVIWMGPILSPLASPTSEGIVWNSCCTIDGRVQLIFANSTITAVTMSVQTWGLVQLGMF